MARGAELAVEIIRGEGYPAEVRSCGSVGPAEGRSLDRQEFHAGNYQAANKNVCGWVVADYSCHSGYTPQVFDELNNRGTLPKAEIKTIAPDGTASTEIVNRACQPAQVNNCANHAAYEFDVAVGQSRSSLPGCALFTPTLRDSLKDAFKISGKSVTFDKSWSHSLYGSRYSDGGYKYCDPVVRDGYTSEPPLRPDNPVAPVTASSTTAKPR